jgi:hypothetical protein
MLPRNNHQKELNKSSLDKESEDNHYEELIQSNHILETMS